MSYLDRNIPPDRIAPPTPKDVRAYLNDGNPAWLCLSCAVKRRLRGKIINLVDDEPLGLPCEDCGEYQAVLL